MWEAIENILISNNGIVIFVLFILLVVLCARFGLIKIKTDKVTIGINASETERTIMRNQIEWCRLSSITFERTMPKYDGYDKYRGKYIAEKVFDEMITWVVFNHIESTPTYIEIKQQIIWNLVQSLIVRKEYQSDKFKKNVYAYVESTIENLVAIRKEYS